MGRQTGGKEGRAEEPATGFRDLWGGRQSGGEGRGGEGRVMMRGRRTRKKRSENSRRGGE